MDGGGFWVWILIILFLLSLVSGLLQIGASLVVMFFVGVATNLVLRNSANRLDWKTIDEGWIWLVIAFLVAVPVVIGVFWVLILPFLALTHGDANALSVCLSVPLYFPWVIGYAWAWWNPRYERGLADVLVSKTLISTWTRLLMWWECQKVRWGLW